MHNHPLFRPLTLKCPCCNALRTFEFHSKHDHVLCSACVEHQGSSGPMAARRDREHIKLWEAVFASVTEQHSARITQIRSEIADRDKEITTLREMVSDLRGALQADLEQRPVATVQQWWNSVQINAAEEKRDAAYRSRDFAMARIWSLDRLHHTDDRRHNYCSCGKETSKCREWKILYEVTVALDRWEERQVERLRGDLPHGLPNDHPEVQRTRPRIWWAV